MKSIAAQVRANPEHALFAADAPGRWTLEDGSARALTLQALRHDETSMDCGRSDCHTAAAEAANASPMSHALERQFAAARGTPATISCLLECHVTGERGLRDGGFVDVAATLDWSWLGRPSWQELPQALRRLGGVRCTSCHGPGAIPEPAARPKLLRSDVCASCHDAPPRYVHVQQWRVSRMARSDATAAARGDAACARCHTTSGFLAALGARARSDTDAAAEPAGIACAACHAPHSAHSAAKLIRPVTLPSSVSGSDVTELEPSSRLCANCHAPTDLRALPSASSAAIWLGRVRVPSLGPSSAPLAAGELVSGPASHRGVPGGCVGCHGKRLSEPAHDHSFRVDETVCASCHRAVVPSERVSAEHGSVRQWAIELQSLLDRRCGPTPQTAPVVPPHAGPVPSGCSSGPLARASYLVRLIVEDPAAGVHNAPFARLLLENAEALMRD